MADISNPKNGNKRSALQIRWAERRRQALELRERGWSYEKITKALGLRKRSSAYRLVQRALKDTYQEPADEVRRLELRRIDRLWESWFPRAMDRRTDKGDPVPPDPKAMEQVMKLMVRRAELLGLDAPVKVSQKIETNINMKDDDLSDEELNGWAQERVLEIAARKRSFGQANGGSTEPGGLRHLGLEGEVEEGSAPGIAQREVPGDRERQDQPPYDHDAAKAR